MSRKIPPKASVSLTEEEMCLRRTDRGKLLFTSYQNRRCSLLIEDNRLMSASFFPETPSRIGAVYIGKLKSMAKNIDACFIEIGDGEICFLSLKDAPAPYLLNRRYDGRLVEGDEILVQVVKDAQKQKKASVTTQISLSNDYFVMMFISAANPDTLKFSLKLLKEKKREIQCVLSEAMKKDSEDSQNILAIKDQDANGLPSIGCLVRTRAGELEDGEALIKHFFALREQMLRLVRTARYRSCFSCLKPAPADFEAIFQQLPRNFKKSFCTFIEDCAGHSFETEGSSGWEIVTDQSSMYDCLKAYCKEHDINVPIRLYQDDRLPLSILYSIESKLETALANRVWLKSGAYLVIEHTEALTVIDVNSGKCEAGRESQETYRRINLEAAQEIAIQLRLRNLSGIIIVDFINMKSEANNRELLTHLRNLVREDSIQTQVIDMTPLGLMEITRKKINKPLREQFHLSGNFLR